MSNGSSRTTVPKLVCDVEQLSRRLGKQASTGGDTTQEGDANLLLDLRKGDSPRDWDSSSTDVYTTDEEAETEGSTEGDSEGWGPSTPSTSEGESDSESDILQEGGGLQGRRCAEGDGSQTRWQGISKSRSGSSTRRNPRWENRLRARLGQQHSQGFSFFSEVLAEPTSSSKREGGKSKSEGGDDRHHTTGLAERSSPQP